MRKCSYFRANGVSSHYWSPFHTNDCVLVMNSKRCNDNDSDNEDSPVTIFPKIFDHQEYYSYETLMSQHLIHSFERQISRVVSRDC